MKRQCVWGWVRHTHTHTHTRMHTRMHAHTCANLVNAALQLVHLLVPLITGPLSVCRTQSQFLHPGVRAGGQSASSPNRCLEHTDTHTHTHTQGCTFSHIRTYIRTYTCHAQSLTPYARKYAHTCKHTHIGTYVHICPTFMYHVVHTMAQFIRSMCVCVWYVSSTYTYVRMYVRTS